MKSLEIIKQQEVLGKDFKVYGNFENPLFLAKDVAEWIEHNKPSEMIRNLDDSEKVSDTIATLGGNQKAWFLTEDGLYEVLMQSRKPIAKAFKKQVKVILKDIRRHGMYAKDELLDNPDLLLEVVTKLKEEREQKLKLQEENEVLEIALNISLDYYTVAKYNKTFKKGWSLKKCQNVGKKLTAYCRANGITVKVCKTNDERFGEVNSYPLKVWNTFLQLDI